MQTEEILTKLKIYGNPVVLRNLKYRGINSRSFGVPKAALRKIAAGMPKDTNIVKKLYETGNIDAMRLSVLLSADNELSRKEFEEMMGTAYCFYIVDEVISNILILSDINVALKLASKWKHSSLSLYQAAGWITLAKLLVKYPDNDFWKYNISNLLNMAGKKYSKQNDIVRYSRSTFVEAAGIHLDFALDKAMDTAEKIGTDKVSLSIKSMKTLDPVGKIKAGKMPLK